MTTRNIKIDAAGLHIDAEGPIAWDEFVAVHAEEIDVMTGSTTVLQLEHINGHVVEMNELDDQYAEVVANLASYLPLPSNWLMLTKGSAILLRR